MPAIQPALLRQQAAMLVESFDNPAAFVRSLHHLLDFYADRVHRPGQAGAPAPLIQAYRVRPPVLRRLQLELTPLAQQQPALALALCDALWAQPYLEFGLLAAGLLGQVDPFPPEPVLDRVYRWIQAGTVHDLVKALLGPGLARMRRENSQTLIRKVERWLYEEDIFHRRIGLLALIPMVADLSFENLPVFFRLAQPFVRETPSGLRPDVLDLLIALAGRSPQETVYFLRQNLALPGSADAAWLARQSAPHFPPDLQESVRAAARPYRSR